MGRALSSLKAEAHAVGRSRVLRGGIGKGVRGVRSHGTASAHRSAAGGREAGSHTGRGRGLQEADIIVTESLLGF